MEDVITASPPPTRLNPDDLNTFTPPPPPLPSPFLVLPTPPPSPPPLLLIAISTPSLHLLHHHPNKTLIGTLVLPEVPLSPNTLLSPSLTNRSCHVYSLPPTNALAVAVQYRVPPERSRAVAKAVVEGVPAEKVLVLDGIRGGRMRLEEGMVFKLESEEQRKNGGGSMVKGLEYLPTGSVVDGVGAAVLAECQLRKVKGTVVATWPDSAFDGSVFKLLREVVRGVLPGLDLGDGSGIRVGAGAGADSDLYS